MERFQEEIETATEGENIGMQLTDVEVAELEGGTLSRGSC